MVVANQVEETEEVDVDDIAKSAVAFVNAEEAGSEKETVTAPVDKVVDSEVTDVIETDDQTTKEKDISGKTEDEAEEASLEDIMADETPKTDVEKSKEGTPEWLQKRIDKQTRQNKEALEEKDRVIADLQAKTFPDKRPPVPVLEDFATKEEYQEKYQEWKDQDDDWKASNRNTVAKATAAQDKLNRNVQKFKDSAERMTAKYDDFDKAVNKDTYYGELDTILLSTDFSGEISYHLAKNPQKLDALLKMDFVEAAIAIGELSGKCKASKTKTLTTAPAVLKTVKDSEGGANEEGVDSAMKEFRKTSNELLNIA
jgi:hypothetical protein